MKFKHKTLIFLLALSFIHSLFGQKIKVPFYSDTITVRHPISDQSFSKLDHTIEDFKVNTMLTSLDRVNWSLLIDDIGSTQTKLRLNDWFVFELTHAISQELFEGWNANSYTVFNFFLLTKLGYNARLTYSENTLFIYCNLKEQLFNTPYTTINGQPFYNISYLILEDPPKIKSVFLIDTKLEPGDQEMSISLSPLPQLPRKEVNRTLTFSYKQKKYAINLVADFNLKEMLMHYPLFQEVNYFLYRLSPETRNTLIPQLEEMLKGKNNIERLKLLTTMMRSAFQYKADEDHLGFTKPLIAEEVLLHEYTDCEDRAALYFQLVKELMDYPMIVVSFRDHITIGIQLENFDGEYIKHNQKKYYICDPTGPNDSSEIGQFPDGYKYRPYEVILEYNKDKSTPVKGLVKN